MSHPDDLLARAWAEREESLYPRLLGALGPGLYPLDAAVFSTVFGQDSVDPRWLTIGVFECPPTPDRPGWAYVSSGLSNPWDETEADPDSVSGLGMEFLLQTTERAPWALTLVQRFCAYQLLLAAGRMGNHAPLDLWNRMRIGAPIDNADSQLQALVFVAAEHLGDIQSLVSGQFRFLQMLPLTLDEHAFGQQHDFETVVEQLQAHHAAPVVDARRGSIALQPPA
ncbi:MAG: suppressor of fused domain protein [Stenotrophomonas rhizophila]|uniref:suppressor of fused domain protein n=1 Tax=Stenotrophomonas rhizophila TaxID=216778 RepID=UPI003D12659F